uniref:Ig-like domain-containing protein n=1 Tax=Romanomermis culicivorax TaxID=13658 RepID=A0A915I629_ROMCU
TNELADYRSYKYVNADHKNFLFNPGRNIELQCEVAHVVPNATVKWHKGGLLLNELENKRIRVVGSKLVINPTEYIDTGHYNCYTNHGILYAIFHEFERNSVTFACQPGAEDRIVYRWYHENKLLTNDIRRHLTISYMTKSDAGNYKCVIIPGDHYAATESRIYHVYDASMYDTGNYTCEIEYMDMVFKSLELEITVRGPLQIVEIDSLSCLKRCRKHVKRQAQLMFD